MPSDNGSRNGGREWVRVKVLKGRFRDGSMRGRAIGMRLRLIIFGGILSDQSPCHGSPHQLSRNGPQLPCYLRKRTGNPKPGRLCSARHLPDRSGVRSSSTLNQAVDLEGVGILPGFLDSAFLTRSWAAQHHHIPNPGRPFNCKQDRRLHQTRQVNIADP